LFFSKFNISKVSSKLSSPLLPFSAHLFFFRSKERDAFSAFISFCKSVCLENAISNSISFIFLIGYPLLDS